MADSLTDEQTVPKAVERGRDILETFAGRHYHYGAPKPLEVEAESIRKDLLSDLMHEAESAGEDVYALIERARDNYEAERGDTMHESAWQAVDAERKAASAADLLSLLSQYMTANDVGRAATLGGVIDHLEQIDKV